MTPNFNFNTDYSRMIDPVDNVFDKEWVKSTFLIPDNQIDSKNEYKKWIKINRYRCSADYKFTSTSPGMNFAINPKPQFTRYADIRSPGKLTDRPKYINPRSMPGKYGLGMGMYYSEAIDDNAQKIFLRFGVPKYSFLAVWMHQAFDIKRTIFSTRGGLSYAILKMIDWATMWFAIAACPLMALGSLIVNVVSTDARFYSVKPTMYLYWATVEDLLNTLVSKRTMLPYLLKDYTTKVDSKIGQELTIDEDFVKKLNELIPDIIDSKGRISVFGLALKAQSAYNRMQHSDYLRSKTANPATNFTDYPSRDGANSHNTYFANKKGETTLWINYIFEQAVNILALDTVLSSDPKQISTNDLIEKDPLYTTADGGNISVNFDPNDTNDTLENRLQSNYVQNQSKWDKFREYALAEFSEGASFAVFNVEYTGSMSESFSNSFTSNPLESMFNSISSKARSVTSMISGATELPVIGDAINLAADAGAILLSNASFGLANPVLAMLYGLNVEMPKIWENSSSSLPTGNYKIKAISPYGNPYSQLFNIYLPLAMVLAGSLPRSTGSASHTSPFCCQIFDKGRFNSSLAMVSSVSLTRGSSNLGFNKAGHTNAIDIDISVSSLDESMSVDIASGGIVENLISAVTSMPKNTPFNDYIATITALDVYHQIYLLPKLRLHFANVLLKANVIMDPDPAAFAAFTVNKIPFENTILKTIVGNSAAAVNDLTKGF